jgi:hypothetical protein
MANTQVNSNIQELPKKASSIFDLNKMRWYELIALLPVLVLGTHGGIIGGVIGVIGWSFALKVMRNTAYSKFVKVTAVLGITAVYYFIAIQVSSFFIGFLEGFAGS